MDLTPIILACRDALEGEDKAGLLRVKTEVHRASLGIISAHSEIAAHVAQRGDIMSQQYRELHEDAVEIYEDLEDGISFLLQSIEQHNLDDSYAALEELEHFQAELVEVSTMIEAASGEEANLSLDLDADFMLG